MDAQFTIAQVGMDDAEFCDFGQLKQRFGIGRSLGYELIQRGVIRSICLRKRGCVKGKRLLDCGSIRKFLAEQTGDIDPRLSAICKKANRVRREKKAEREKERAA